MTLVTERFHVPRGRALLEAALAREGLGDVPVTASPAPDGVPPAGRARLAALEREKLVRDLGFLRDAWEAAA